MNDPEDTPPEGYQLDTADAIVVFGCLVALAVFFALLFAGVITP